MTEMFFGDTRVGITIPDTTMWEWESELFIIALVPIWWPLEIQLCSTTQVESRIPRSVRNLYFQIIQAILIQPLESGRFIQIQEEFQILQMDLKRFIPILADTI